MSDRMAERDRAKRMLLLRLVLSVVLPLVGLALAWLAAGALWGLAGFGAGVAVAVAVVPRVRM